MSDSLHKFLCLRAVVDGGHLARMNRLELAVYIALYNDADGRTRQVETGAERIARVAGDSNVGRVRKTMQMLATLGFLNIIEEGGGWRRPTIRELLIIEPLPVSPLFDTGAESDTRTPYVPVSNTNYPDTNRGETGTFFDTYRDKNTQLPGHRMSPNHRDHGNHSTSREENDGGGVVVLKTPAPTPIPPPQTPQPPHTNFNDSEVMVFLLSKGVYRGPAQSYADYFTLAQVQDLWKTVLSKPKVRDRAAMFNAILGKNMPAKDAPPNLKFNGGAA